MAEPAVISERLNIREKTVVDLLEKLKPIKEGEKNERQGKKEKE